MGDEPSGRARLLPRSRVGVVGSWLVFAWPGNPVIRLDLRMLDRVSSRDDDDGPAAAGSGALLALARGELETVLHIADGAEAVRRLVRESAPHTREGAVAMGPVPATRPSTGTARLLVVSSSPDGEAGTTRLDGLVFELTAPHATLGRTDDCDIVLDHGSISRTHARISRDAAGLHVIENVGSTNGVRINGEVRETAPLRDGDIVDLGHVRLRFLDAFDAPFDPDRCLIVGRNPVVRRGDRIEIGDQAFSLKQVRKHAKDGRNLRIGEQQVLQAGLALFVGEAAGTDASWDVEVEAFWTARTGSGGGPAIVWLHGGPGLWDYLGPIAAMTDAVCVSYRYDQRGCGRTRARGGSSVAQSVADLDALREHWGLERIVVAGHGWGASLALHYSLAHPDRVAARVLIGTCGVIAGSREAADEELGRRLGPTGEARLVALGERLEADNRLADERALLETLWAPDFVDPATVRTLFVEELRINGSVHVSLREADRWSVTMTPFLERLREDAIPTLVMHGEQDPRPLDAARELAALLPAAELLVVPGAGHYPWLEAPDVVRAGLCGFMRRP